MISTHAEADVPVLWLCGASGVGKSVAAWALFQSLGDEGLQVAYVDIDQLGMLYPESKADPYRYRLKTEALASLLPNYAAAGVRVLVVSGVVDPASPRSAPNETTTFCLLTVDDTTLRRRILARGWDEEEADEAVAEAHALLDAPFIDAVVDTTARSIAEVVACIRPLVSLYDARSGPCESGEAASLPSTPVGLDIVSGPRGVGSSMVGFGLARSRWSAGRTAGFMDLQQLAFVRLPDQQGHLNTGLGIANAATLHRLFALRGAEQVIVTAHLSTRAEYDSMRCCAPDSQVTIIRLEADAPTLAAHLRERTAGSEARLAGDDLLGASEAQQAAILETALAQQQSLGDASGEDLLIDVSGRGVDDVLAEVQNLTSQSRETR